MFLLLCFAAIQKSKRSPSSRIFCESTAREHQTNGCGSDMSHASRKFRAIAHPGLPKPLAARAALFLASLPVWRSQFSKRSAAGGISSFWTWTILAIRRRNACPADKIQPKPAGLSPKPRQAHASRIQEDAKLLNCNGRARDMSDPHPDKRQTLKMQAGQMRTLLRKPRIRLGST